MSVWLSSANKVMDSARGQTTAAAFRTRQGEGIKVNFLVNYGWEWDLMALRKADYGRPPGAHLN